MASKKKHTPPLGQPAIKKYAPAIENNISNDSIKETISIKEEALRWIFSIIGALFCYLIVATIIRSVYHPDINTLLAVANKLSFAGDARPEPVESLLFRSGVVTITLGMLGFYMLFTKLSIVRKLAADPFFLIFSSLCCALFIGLVLMDFTAQNPFAAGGGDIPQHSRDFIENKSNFAFFFDGIFLGKYLLLYTFILVPALACLFFIGLKKYNLEDKKIYNTSVSVIGYLVCGGVLLAIILMNTFDFPYSFVNKHNTNAVYYSMTQVYAGVPMLVDGFSNTYGLYPQFLNIIFQVIGLSMFKFSLVLSLLLGLSFVFIFYFLKQFVNNKVILFLGILSVVFFPYLDDKFTNPFDCIFSFFPIRILVPATLVLLSTLYLKKRSQVIYWATFFVMATFILWNPEFGMVSYAAWVLFNVYNDFYTKAGAVNIKKIIMHLLAAIGICAFVFLAYKFLVYIFYGASPDFKMLFGLALAFGKAGFGCLPMKLVHPWNIMALVDMLGILYAIITWYKKDITPKSSMLLLVSIVSLGFFVYFQGRSHNCCFVVSTIFSFVILTILGDELWGKIKNQNIFSLNVLFVIFLFFISFSFFEVIFNAGKFNELIHQDDDKSAQQAEQDRIENNAGFFLKNTSPHEKLFLFTAREYSGLYFNGSKRISAFNPGAQDMFLNTDLVRMEDKIIASSYPVFLEPTLFNFFFMARPIAAVAATYDLKQVNLTMDILTKRTIKIPAKTFFGADNSTIFHRKYSDDTSGIKRRIDDGFGSAPVLTGPVFSIQTLFYPEPQVYPYATIAGNMDDSSGFLMANVINTKNYVFGINGKTFILGMTENQWVYCVWNVYPDHMEIYENGTLASAAQLDKPMRLSPQKLYVGNLGGFRYYVGAIAEISIANKAIDKNEIQSNWALIKQ